VTRPSLALMSPLAALVCVFIVGGAWLWGPSDSESGLLDQGGAAEVEQADPESAQAPVPPKAETPTTRSEAVADDPAPTVGPIGEGAVISGSVHDENAVAQVGAELRLLRVVREQADWAEFPWVASEAAHPPDAEYKFTQLERGKEYAVVASAGTRWVASRPTLAPARVELSFPERFLVQATIRNLAGKVVEGARLSLVPIDGPGPQLGAASSQSNAAGEVKLEVQAGRFGLAVHHASGQLVRKELIEITGPTQLGDLVLAAGGEVLLHVRQYGANSPMDDARIRRQIVAHKPVLGDPDWKTVLAMPGGPGASDFVYDTEARAYRLASAAPGKHAFTVGAPNYTSRSVKVVVRAGETTEETVALHPSSRLLVRLIDSQGEPVVGQHLRFKAAIRDRSFRSGDPKTDEKGEVLFWGLQPRDYFVFQDNEDGRPLQVNRVTVKVGENEVEIVSARVEGVMIRLARGNEPMQGATVMVSLMEQGAEPTKNDRFLGFVPGQHKTDAEGLVTLPPIAPGDYSLAIQVEGGGIWARRCTVTHSAQLVEIDCPTRTVFGRIVPASEGVRVGLFQVSGDTASFGDLVRSNARSWFINAPHDSQVRVVNSMTWLAGVHTKTDAEGEFVFRDIGEGQFFLMAIADDGRASSVETLQIADLDPDEVVLAIADCATIRVETTNLQTALATTGERSISASIWRPGGELPLMLKTLKEGAILFEYLQPGELTVEIRYYDAEKREKVVLQSLQVTVERGKTEVVRWDGASAR
jgi:hypothetical protein